MQLVTPGGLVYVSAWVPEDRVAEAQEALARWAREPTREWSVDEMFDFLGSLSTRGEKVMRLLSDDEHEGRWLRSRDVADEMALSVADLGGTISAISKEASTRGLASPIRSALRRGPDRKPVRHLHMSTSVADLVAEVPRRKTASEVDAVRRKLGDGAVGKPRVAASKRRVVRSSPDT
jgi:hypothetical protein